MKIALILCFLLFRSAILLTYSDPGDVVRYHGWAEKQLKGQIAYRDFSLEYPPLVPLYVLPPAFLSRDGSFAQYHRLYRVQGYLVDLATFFLLLRRRQAQPAMLWVYLIGSSILGSLLYDRLDVALGFLLVSMLVLRERESLCLSYVLLGLGAAFKLVPALLFPCLLSWDVANKRLRVWRAAACFGLAAGIPYLCAFLLCGPKAFDHLAYQSERGIQVESVWASLQAVAVHLGIPVEVYRSHGSENIRGALESWLLVLSTALTVGLPLVAILLNRVRKTDTAWLPVAATLCGLVTFSKVLSPQYLIFLLPVLACAGEPQRLRRFWPISIVLICALTTWVYPHHYMSLLKLDGLTVAANAARNIALVALTAWLYGRWLGCPHTRSSGVLSSLDTGQPDSVPAGIQR